MKVVGTVSEYSDRVDHRLSMIVDREPGNDHFPSGMHNSTFEIHVFVIDGVLTLDNSLSYFDDEYKR